MTGVLECHVLGTPAPQGSKTRGANGGMWESSKKVKPWREAVVAQVRDQLGDADPLDGPVYVGVTFYLQRPQSHYRKRLRDRVASYVLRTDVGNHSYKRPDIDKLVRSTLDALTTTGVFRDDAQVAVLVAEKRYVDDEHPTPGAFLTVESLTIVEAA